jgi:hypothetical protein
LRETGGVVVYFDARSQISATPWAQIFPANEKNNALMWRVYAKKSKAIRAYVVFFYM